MAQALPPVHGRALHQEWKDVLLTSWQSLLKKVKDVSRLLDSLLDEQVLTRGSHGRLVATMPSAKQGASSLWCNAVLAALPPDRRGFEGLKRALHKLGEIEALQYLFSQWAYETVCLTPPVSPANGPVMLEEPEHPYIRIEDVLPAVSSPGNSGQFQFNIL